MNDDEDEKKELKQTGSADDMTRDNQTISDMLSVRHLSNVVGVANKSTRVARAFIIWPLVIYSLIQFNAYLLANNHQYLSSSYFSQLQLNQQTTGSQSSEHSQTAQFSANLRCQIPTASSCSSKAKISQQANDETLLQSLSSAYLSLLQLLNQNNHRYSFGGTIQFAEAISVQYQAPRDKGVIVLDSSNFNSELIQHKYPFPHIKLIDYYLSYSNYSKKFTQVFFELAKQIQSWRNVIRPSVIDLAQPDNNQIANSWMIETVPTLRFHPPPNPSLARVLNEQLELWIRTLVASDLQKYTFHQYNGSSLMVKTLENVVQYKDPQLLKADILRYIEAYVRETPGELPISWPNLRPVTEESLHELRLNHPRQELFLIIDGSMSPIATDQSSSVTPSLAFSMMMELSSSSAWKAVRYVRASENKALIEDVIEQQNKSSEHRVSPLTTQVDLLNDLLSSQSTDSNNVLLVHLNDNSESLAKTKGSSVAAPLMTIISVADLISMDKSTSNGQKESYNSRAKRFTDQDSSLSKIPSTEKLVELVANFINQTYTETSIDREFVEALSSFDESGKLNDTSTYLNHLSEESRKVQQPRLKKADFDNQVSDQITVNETSLLSKVRVFWHDLIYPPNGELKSATTYSRSTDVYFKYIIVTCICCLILVVVLRCSTYYVEMQRRRKTVLLNGNGNGTRYSVELQ